VSHHSRRSTRNDNGCLAGRVQREVGQVRTHSPTHLPTVRKAARRGLRLRLRFEQLGSHHTAIGEGPHLPALTCSSHWSLGLYLASVDRSRGFEQRARSCAHDPRHSPLFSHTKRGYESESESHLYAAHNSWSEANVTNAAYNNDASQRSQHPDVHTHTNETP
jgi:hypothetical protein